MNAPDLTRPGPRAGEFQWFSFVAVGTLAGNMGTTKLWLFSGPCGASKVNMSLESALKSQEQSCVYSQLHGHKWQSLMAKSCSTRDFLVGCSSQRQISFGSVCVLEERKSLKQQTQARSMSRGNCVHTYSCT